jgi:hypothetical protein
VHDAHSKAVPHRIAILSLVVQLSVFEPVFGVACLTPLGLGQKHKI